MRAQREKEWATHVEVVTEDDTAIQKAHRDTESNRDDW